MLPSQIGYFSLILGLFFSVILILFSIRNFSKDGTLDNKIISLSLLQFVSVIISFFGLIFSFIISDFSNETVFNNSHTTKPLFYKITGSWGNHEGSLLLWLMVLTLFIYLFLITTKNHPKKYRILTLLFQQTIIIGFFIFLIKTSSPFNYLFPPPQEGLGLNPILQDPALAIHPPILYLGYVGSSVIFSSSLAATTLNYVSKEWAMHMKKWVLISWIFLSIGIMLGSLWAYYELGWGGFWFWDPVENVSLMPWLTLTALLHCILVLERRLILTSWVIILSISTFTLSMCGTFLVRSGILNSVHTFANDPERGIYILIFLFFLILLSLIVFFFFNRENNNETGRIFWLSKDASILINNWFMMYFLSVVLIGTLYPIFLDVISNQKISVGPPFYHKLIIPFLIPFLIFMAIGPKLKWLKSNLDNKISLVILFLASAITALFVLKNSDSNLLLNTILISGSLFLFLVTIKDLFLRESKFLSQKVAHFGFSLLILSILINGFFTTEIITNLKVGDNFIFENKNIYLEKIEKKEKENYKAIIGYFEIKDEIGKIIYLKPELRIYNQPEIITSEADIKSGFFKDEFLVMNNINNQEYFNIRYQIKPFMILIWISVLIFSLGGLISLLNRGYEK